MEILKKCSLCKNDKPLQDFNLNSNKKDGRQHYCKICESQYNKESYRKNKDKRIAQIIKWNKEHPEELKKYKETFRAKK